MIKQTKENYFKSDTKANRRNAKELYKLINGLTWSEKANPLPPGYSDQEQANEFSHYFSEKTEKIRNNLTNTDLWSTKQEHCNNSWEF